MEKDGTCVIYYKGGDKMKKSKINIYEKYKEDNPIETKLEAVEIGTVFRGYVGGRGESIFWRAYNSIFDLKDLVHTWDHPECDVTITEILDMDINIKKRR